MRKIVATMLFAVAMLSGGAAAHAQANEPRGMEQEFVSLVNDLRASEGLAPLAIHTELVQKGRGWSATMADDGDIWHSHLPDGITAPWRRLGENVGKGGSVRALHDALVASPSHYANLVDAGFTHLGVGVVIDGNGTIFVSQEFMELQPVPAPAGATAAPPARNTAPFDRKEAQPAATVEPRQRPVVAGSDSGRSPESPALVADRGPDAPTGSAATPPEERQARLTTALNALSQTTGAHYLGLSAVGSLLAAAAGLRWVAGRGSIPPEIGSGTR